MTKNNYQKSILVQKWKKDIKREYTKSGRLPSDEEKAMWGSRKSMLNRYQLGFQTVQWKDVKTWLDIGCGVGRFFRTADERNLLFQKLIGVDFTESLVLQARKHSLKSPVRFEVSDLERMPEDILNVDLITLVGVLQLCGCELEKALDCSIGRLAENGQLFLTTKHLGWSEFIKKKINPDPAHSWFVMEDVRQAVRNCGVNILSEGGFLPREGKVVPLKDAHTLFVYGRKDAKND